MITRIPTTSRRLSFRRAALLAVLLSMSSRMSFAAEDVDKLVDQGISQIVADEVTERMSKFLGSYRIQALSTVSIEGKFRSLTSDDLEQQMTTSLGNRGITIDGTSNITLEGELVVTQTKEAVIVVMDCSLAERDRGQLCTVRVRKVLPVAPAS